MKFFYSTIHVKTNKIYNNYSLKACLVCLSESEVRSWCSVWVRGVRAVSRVGSSSQGCRHGRGCGHVGRGYGVVDRVGVVASGVGADGQGCWYRCWNDAGWAYCNQGQGEDELEMKVIIRKFSRRIVSWDYGEIIKL